MIKKIEFLGNIKMATNILLQVSILLNSVLASQKYNNGLFLGLDCNSVDCDMYDKTIEEFYSVENGLVRCDVGKLHQKYCESVCKKYGEYVRCEDFDYAKLSMCSYDACEFNGRNVRLEHIFGNNEEIYRLIPYGIHPLNSCDEEE